LENKISQDKILTGKEFEVENIKLMEECP